MIGISKLYCGQAEASDVLRYGRSSEKLPSHLLQFSSDKKPVIVWNMTQRCNLRCVHCYAHAVGVDGGDVIGTHQARAMIDDLAAYGCPVLLFSGGEPLVRDDLVELASHATSRGMRAVISTNGTLISRSRARELKAVGLSYVGISLDGLEDVHDRFRCVPGAFRKALDGIANCQAEGLKVGLRFTMNKRNVREIPGIFALLRDLEIPRACFYHLVYSGRGSSLISEDLDHAETRAVLDLIMDETRKLFEAGKPFASSGRIPCARQRSMNFCNITRATIPAAASAAFPWMAACMLTSFGESMFSAMFWNVRFQRSGMIRPLNCCISLRTRRPMWAGVAPDAVFLAFAAAISVRGPRPFTATSGRRIRPAI